MTMLYGHGESEATATLARENGLTLQRFYSFTHLAPKASGENLEVAIQIRKTPAKGFLTRKSFQSMKNTLPFTQWAWS